MSEERGVSVGLWVQKNKDGSIRLDKNGNQYYTGLIQDKETSISKALTDLSAFFGAALHHGDKIRVMAFRNKKTKDTQPDINIVFSVVGERQEQQGPFNNGDDEGLPF